MSIGRTFKGLLLALVLVLGANELNAGTGAIPKGPDVLILKPNLLFKGGDTKIMTNDTDAPNAVAKDAERGSAYIEDDTATWWKKTDDGNTTNWQLFIFGALGLTGTDECVPRWDGTGTGVLQDSLLCIDDAGFGTGLTGLDVDNLRLDGNTLSSTDVNGNVNITPNGTGEVVASTLEVTDLTDDRIIRPDGANGLVSSGVTINAADEILNATRLTVDNLQLDANAITSTDVNGNISLTPNGTGEVIASTLEVTDLTDDRLIRADGANGLVTSGVILNALDEILGATRLTVDNLQLDGNSLISTDANGDVNITPNGTGEVVASTLEITDIADDRIMRADGANGIVASGVEINAANEILGATRLTVDNLQLDANTLSSTNVNGDILLDPNGTGNINFPDLTASTPLKLDASNNVISADIDLTTDVTGVLPIANGGTNSSTALNNNRHMISSGGAIVEHSALTQGSVFFGDANGLLEEDNANFFWDDTNNNLNIGDNTTDTSAIFELTSTSKGMFTPRMTEAQRDAITVSAAREGLLLYNTDTDKFDFYNGSSWGPIDTVIGLSSGSLALDTYVELQAPESQLTVIDTTANNKVVRLETGNDSFLANGSFEHEIFDTSWTDGGDGTEAEEVTIVFEGGKSYEYVTAGGTEAMNTSQLQTKTQFEGVIVGATCMVRSDSDQVKLCVGTTTDDELDCVFHDGSSEWRKLQAIMEVDSTGEMELSVKTEGDVNATVYVDSCSWSNNPLKIKNVMQEQEYRVTQAQTALSDRTNEVQFNLGTATITSQGPTLINAEDDAANTRTRFVAKKDITVHISVDAVNDTASRPLCIAKNGVISQRGSVPDATATNVTFAVDQTIKLSQGEYLTYGSCSTLEASGFDGSGVVNIASYSTHVQILAYEINEEVITAADRVSSETLGFVFKGSGSGGIDCSTDPVGTYTTYSKAASGNSFTQCAAAPTTVPNNTDGIFLTSVAYSASSGCTTPARFDICIGKGMRAVSPSATVGANKTGNSIRVDKVSLASTAYGLDKFYEERTGYLQLSAGLSDTSGITTRVFTDANASGFASAYIHFHASKNPVVNSVQNPINSECFFKNIQASNTASDSATGGGTYDTLTVNTISGDCTGLLLASDQITLPAGEYSVNFVIPTYRGDSYKCRLRNITDSTTDILGSTGFADNQATSNGQAHCHIRGKLTLSASKVYEIQGAMSNGAGSWGTPYNTGEQEVYLQGSFRRTK